jgi:hypothetical protein
MDTNLAGNSFVPLQSFLVPVSSWPRTSRKWTPKDAKLRRSSLAPIRVSGDDFGANPVSGKNLQKERMRNPAVN